MTEHEFHQIRLGAAYDNHTGPEASDRKRDEAMLFESNLSKYFKENGLKFLREEEIRKRYGKDALTPDFLFEPPTLMNGVKNKWIDAKDFIGSKLVGNIRFKKLQAQAKKYIDFYGP